MNKQCNYIHYRLVPWCKYFDFEITKDTWKGEKCPRYESEKGG